MEPLLNTVATGPAGPAKESSTAAFRADVLEASMQAPVIVDFWAPWCGPCKTLGPAIERVVAATRGKVRLVKINVDENRQLADQFRVQSIPTVYAFYQGRPVDAFQGALPEGQIKTFVDRLIQMAGGPEAGLEEALAQAKATLDAGDFRTAGGIYQQILEVEPDSASAVAGLARALIGLGQAAQAQQLLAQVSDKVAKSPDVISVKRTLELAEESAGAIGRIPGLRQRLDGDADDHGARFDLAMALYGAGQKAEAVDQLLEIIRRDRGWNDQAARTQLLKFFEAFGPSDKLTLSGRRRLSSLLFA